jgi:hypothetical protein
MMAADPLNRTTEKLGMATKKTSVAKSEAKTGAKASKSPKEKRAKSDASGARKLSAIDAAAQVLSESSQAMNAKELIDAMSAQGLWTSPGGKTPHATLYSALLREIATKGDTSRFRKIERGKFAANV